MSRRGFQRFFFAHLVNIYDLSSYGKRCRWGCCMDQSNLRTRESHDCQRICGRHIGVAPLFHLLASVPFTICAEFRQSLTAATAVCTVRNAPTPSPQWVLTAQSRNVIAPFSNLRKCSPLRMANGCAHCPSNLPKGRPPSLLSRIEYYAVYSDVNISARLGYVT